MAQKGDCEFLRRATVCPKHGSTHIHRHITPEPGDYFAAYYTPACCAAHEIDRWQQARAAQETRSK